MAAAVDVCLHRLPVHEAKQDIRHSVELDQAATEMESAKSQQQSSLGSMQSELASAKQLADQAKVRVKYASRDDCYELCSS
jgi:hypothetical protein